MSDKPVSPVEAVAPVGAIAPTHPAQGVRVPHPSGAPVEPRHDPAVVSTVAPLGASYAQFVVDPSSQDVVLKIRDAATDRVLTELPSPAIQAADKSLREYAKLLERRHAANQSAHAAGDVPAH
jgi:hypothetical protein